MALAVAEPILFDPSTEILFGQMPTEVKRRIGSWSDWKAAQHVFQVPPGGDWIGWMLQGGRGSGKTRVGAEDAVDYCLGFTGVRYAIVAETYADGRDTCIEGESGVRDILNTRDVDYTWNRSLGELLFPNGSRIDIYSAEKPNQLRGPQHHRAWCDEASSWKDAHLGDALNTTYNNLMLGLRLGHDPRVLITTTPRPLKLIRELVDDPDVYVTHGRTGDNAANLAAPFLKRLLRYEGTRIGRQEIGGELLEDIEAALFRLAWIDTRRVKYTSLPTMRRIVVGVDPSGGTAHCGIVVVGLVAHQQCPCGDRPDLNHFIVLEDATIPGSTKDWGEAVIASYQRTDADFIVAERNFGADMVEKITRTAARDMGARIAFKPVHASKGKAIRAEPASQAYEQGRVHHLGAFPALEDEMTTWVPPGQAEASAWSPNRLDALVWSLWELDGRTAQTVTVDDGGDARLPRVG